MVPPDGKFPWWGAAAISIHVALLALVVNLLRFNGADASWGEFAILGACVVLLVDLLFGLASLAAMTRAALLSDLLRLAFGAAGAGGAVVGVVTFVRFVVDIGGGLTTLIGAGSLAGGYVLVSAHVARLMFFGSARAIRRDSLLGDSPVGSGAMGDFREIHIPELTPARGPQPHGAPTPAPALVPCLQCGHGNAHSAVRCLYCSAPLSTPPRAHGN